jgi:osmotically-inducible protein OsmY
MARPPCPSRRSAGLLVGALFAIFRVAAGRNAMAWMGIVVPCPSPQLKAGTLVQSTLLPETDSDTDLQTRVVSFLAGCHMPGLRQLAVDAKQGVVTLRGRVRTYYEKQLGGQGARRVAGVVKLVDCIDVG